jgi:hypothetical protein
MRTILAAMLVTAGIGLVSTSAASAMPINAATMAGAAHIGLVTQVHCRSYVHWHPWVMVMAAGTMAVGVGTTVGAGRIITIIGSLIIGIMTGIITGADARVRSPAARDSAVVNAPSMPEGL